MRIRHTTFVASLIGVLIGVALGGIISLDTAPVLLFVAACILVLGLISSHKKIFASCALILLSISLGTMRYHAWEGVQNNPILESQIGKSIIAEGIIIDEPDIRETGTRLSVALSSVEMKNKKYDVRGTVLVSTNRYPEYHYGDSITIRGTLLQPEKFSKEDGRQFDYPQYLKTQGISYQMFRPVIVRTGTNLGNTIRARLFGVKQKFLESMAQVLPEPENALAGGILLGEKQSLGEEWVERFRIVGIVHVIVLSGYNMTIVAEWLGASFLFLGFLGSLSVSALGIILFTVAVGGGATVIRAALMALCVLCARLLGRPYTMGRALLVAAVLMVLQNPGVLLYDPSFQLSFLAALGLLFVSPVIKSKFTHLRQYPKIEEIVVSTIATQVLVLPLLLYSTGLLSLVALIANCLVLPVIPLAMVLSFFTGLLGFIGPVFALLPALIAQILLGWVLTVGEYGARIPFASLHVPMFSGMVLVGLYGIIAVVLYRARRYVVRDTSPVDSSSKETLFM